MLYKNEKGVALIVAIIVAFIILALGSMALYMSTRSTNISGRFSVYRSSIEAAYGAFRETSSILGYIKDNKSITVPFNITDIRATCLHYKLTTPTVNWTDSDLSANGCLARTVSLAEDTNYNSIINYYELKFSLGDYNVYLKVVNSSTGNTQLRGNKLRKGGTTRQNIRKTPLAPYIYRIEIVAVSKLNPYDFSHVSLLYAF